MSTLVVPARFNGPPRSANGGWVSGALAALLTPLPASAPDDAVRVVLRTPPPLDVPLEVRPDDDGLGAWDGDQLVAHAAEVPSPFAGPAPAAVPWDVASGTSRSYAGADAHPFPTCFTCGPERAEGDGLRLTPGPLPGRPATTACAWVPEASVAVGHEVPTAVCWAAMDCPGGWSVDLAGRPMVLGTMTAQVHELPRVGARHVVVGRSLGEQGRKAFTETALYTVPEDVPDDGAAGGAAGGGDEDGQRLLARATAVWIRVDPAAVRPAR